MHGARRGARLACDDDPMGAPLHHFALNADDVEGARRFYEAVLGWTFEAWGPPGFYRVSTGDERVGGALQRRRELVPGVAMVGLEGTFAVDDVESVCGFRDCHVRDGDLVWSYHLVSRYESGNCSVSDGDEEVLGADRREVEDPVYCVR